MSQQELEGVISHQVPVQDLLDVLRGRFISETLWLTNCIIAALLGAPNGNEMVEAHLAAREVHAYHRNRNRSLTTLVPLLHAYADVQQAQYLPIDTQCRVRHPVLYGRQSLMSTCDPCDATCNSSDAISLLPTKG
jgi:hypothetical protein